MKTPITRTAQPRAENAEKCYKTRRQAKILTSRTLRTMSEFLRRQQSIIHLSAFSK